MAVTKRVPKLRRVRNAETRARQAREEQLLFAIELQAELDRGVYRKHGYSSPWAYLLAEICPALGWDQGKLARLLMAAREMKNVVRFRRPDAGPINITALSMLHTERRRQAKGKGRVAPKSFAQLVRKVANGKLSKREVGHALKCAA